MVDWDWVREDCLNCCFPGVSFLLLCFWGDKMQKIGLGDLPSSIPRPERRIGMREMELGERV